VVFFMLTLEPMSATCASHLDRAGRVLFFFSTLAFEQEHVATLPLVLLLLDYWPLKRFPDFPPSPTAAASRFRLPI